MNTKIIVALVIGITLVGLTGAASAALYDMESHYTYLDSAIAGPGDDYLNADTKLNSRLTGHELGIAGTGDKIMMHTRVKNDMCIKVGDRGPETSVGLGLAQGGGNSLTIATGAIVSEPGEDVVRRNILKSASNAFQNVNYGAVDGNGDIFGIGFVGTSTTHAGTHRGILPLEHVSVTDKNFAAGGAWVSSDCKCVPGQGMVKVPEASIKSGNFGYEANSGGLVIMEGAHVEKALAGSGIELWANAEGEIWESGGKITNVIGGLQSVEVNWWEPQG